MTANAPYVQIPLYLVQVSPGEIKVGIKIAINGGLPMLYELDTGASGFYPAAEIPANKGVSSTSLAWWTDFQAPAGIASFTQKYSSGNCYTAVSTPATLTFEGNSYIYSSETNAYQAGPVPAVTVNVGAVIGATNSNNSGFAENWVQSLTNANTDIANGDSVTAGPLDSYFFGDFGIGLGNAANGAADEGAPVLAVLPQFPFPFCTQFTIALGAQPCEADWKKATNNTIAQGVLTLLVPPTSFGDNPIPVAMNPATPPQFYPSSGVLPFPPITTFDQAQINADFSLSNPANTADISAVPMVLDTGCPSMVIHLGESGALSLSTGSQLEDLLIETGTPNGKGKITVINGTQVSFQPAVTTAFKADNGANSVSATLLTANKPGKQNGYVNTSIRTFFDNTVTFSLSDGTLTLYPQKG
ncbi:hypothetical protein [Niveispirillum sp. BGYR6]|uniref:hypothetical protein n=1 Tax=Niveispirillum sp. BGYR6 TaxID=2971249 RepID=UPI0022B98F84|nr:hypothetical protein [Niveispirillum sp. BGYR6]MDG5495579.1 hypothetical protein [Niveispirillum sp. BGYR6]